MKEIRKTFPQLTENDVRSTSMGASGKDILLSESALSLFPFAVECKNRKSMAVYADFAQCVANSEPPKALPLLVIKANYEEPLAIVKLTDFMEIIQRASKQSN